jgi:hypothetical protein
MKSIKKIILIIIVLVLFLGPLFIGNNSVNTGISEEKIENQTETNFKTAQVQDINIITPENTTYTSPMSGYYPATYGFENDQNGQTPTDWVYNAPIGDANVIEEFDGHNKVVKLLDLNGYF